MSQADEIASGGQAGEGVDRVAQLMHRMDATQPTATFKKVMALTSAGVFVDAMDVYLAGGVKSTLAETGFATNEQTAAFLSAGFLGLFIGSLIAGLIGDKLGRRKAFQFNLLLFGFATILGALSPNMTFMIAMRFFVGLGLGSELVTSFSMINEFAPVARRGRWCAIGSTIANCGSPIGMFLCLFFITIWSPLGQESWRLVFSVIGVAAIIVCIARQAMPESPRWLIKHAKFDEASHHHQPRNEVAALGVSCEGRALWAHIASASTTRETYRAHLHEYRSGQPAAVICSTAMKRRFGYWRSSKHPVSKSLGRCYHSTASPRSPLSS